MHSISTAAPAQQPAADILVSGEQILANAKAVATRVRDADLAAQHDELRGLPVNIVEQLRAAGIMGMNTPRDWGGPELTSMEQVLVIEELAGADASVAWCSSIWCDSGLYAGYLDDAVAREMYPRLDMATSGWVYPVGRAVRADGGYRVTGNWIFGSGTDHCDWLAAGCIVDDADGAPSGDLLDQWRIMLAPRSSYEILDTWYTTGLRGTGSNDYRCHDLFVPEEHSFSFFAPAARTGPLWARPDTLLRKMAGVPLGVAADALAVARTTMETKADRVLGLPYRDMPRVQSAIAEQHAALASARSYVFSSLEAQWAKLEGGAPLTVEERANVWLARTNAFQTARRVVTALYDLVGGSAVYSRKSPFDRHVRDMQTMCQHIAAQTKGWEAVGSLLLGADTVNPLL
jgi:alkylation response protein AidB-like acyl-CoA dehydrogenase